MEDFELYTNQQKAKHYPKSQPYQIGPAGYRRRSFLTRRRTIAIVLSVISSTLLAGMGYEIVSRMKDTASLEEQTMAVVPFRHLIEKFSHSSKNTPGLTMPENKRPLHSLNTIGDTSQKMEFALNAKDELPGEDLLQGNLSDAYNNLLEMQALYENKLAQMAMANQTQEKELTAKLTELQSAYKKELHRSSQLKAQLEAATRFTSGLKNQVAVHKTLLSQAFSKTTPIKLKTKVASLMMRLSQEKLRMQEIEKNLQEAMQTVSELQERNKLLEQQMQNK